MISVFHLAPHICPLLFLFSRLWGSLYNPPREVCLLLGLSRPCMFGEGINFLCRIYQTCCFHWAFKSVWCLHFRPFWTSALWVRHSRCFLTPANLLPGVNFPCSAESVTTYPSAFLLPKLSWHFSSLLLPLWVYSFIPFGGFRGE